MNFAVCVMADARTAYTRDTLESLKANLPAGVSRFVLHDDSCDPSYAAWLDGYMSAYWPEFEVIHAPEKRGFGGAMKFMWDYVGEDLDIDYVFWVENDFTFNVPIELSAMAAVLEQHPRVVEMSLMRQSWSRREKLAGGVFECFPPGSFKPAMTAGRKWLMHSEFFTTNPSLIPSWVLRLGWPEGGESEGVFGIKARELGLSFGYWGDLSDPPRVTHIGYDRVAQESGY